MAVPEFVSSTFVILLCSTLGLVILLLVMVIGISRRLTRIEARQIEAEFRDEAIGSGLAPVETSIGGAFETFLNEDGARRLLSKAEQFAAYRSWRQEKGLNWSNS